jgi:DNA-binding XRE family transcriptional regulator
MQLDDIEDLISRGREIRGNRSRMEIAKRVDVYPTTIMRWEKGSHRPTLADAVKYARVLREILAEMQVA